MHAGDRADRVEPGVAGVVVTGLVALAVAMGVGRFAFTPIMPVMGADAGLTLRAASWLAAANYLGYLIGALCAARLMPAQGVRGGLLLVAVATFVMGLTHLVWLQLLLRLAAGVASAWVLVHVSSWALERLAARGRSEVAGAVYAGVGVGIGLAGLLVLGTMQIGLGSDGTWRLFGVLSLLAALALWPAFGATAASVPAPRRRVRDARQLTTDQWRLLWCYGMLGIGYILPATYLPDMAHRHVTEPLLFGLAWPVFGAAAALSTWLAARWLRHVNDRRLWALCYVAMAAGNALPALWDSLAAILVSAILVGGTFMVVTMQGLREARRSGGAHPTAFIALMTAAFALMQIVGPLLVGVVEGLRYGFDASLVGAALLLLLAAAALWRSAGAAPR